MIFQVAMKCDAHVVLEHVVQVEADSEAEAIRFAEAGEYDQDIADTIVEVSERELIDGAASTASRVG